MSKFMTLIEQEGTARQRASCFVCNSKHKAEIEQAYTEGVPKTYIARAMKKLGEGADLQINSIVGHVTKHMTTCMTKGK